MVLEGGSLIDDFGIWGVLKTFYWSFGEVIIIFLSTIDDLLEKNQRTKKCRRPLKIPAIFNLYF
jgi:hypothetical protein